MMRNDRYGEEKSSPVLFNGVENRHYFARNTGIAAVRIPTFTWAVFPCKGAMPNALQDVNTRIYSCRLSLIFKDNFINVLYSSFAKNSPKLPS